MPSMLSDSGDWDDDDIPENVRYKKANLHKIRNHHNRCIKKPYSWLNEIDGAYGSKIGKVSAKVKREILCVEFRPLSAESYNDIRDSHINTFTFIEENLEEYLNIRYGKYRKEGEKFTVDWTQEELEFMTNYDNTTLPFEYAILSETLKKGHPELKNYYKRIAFVRKIVAKENFSSHWDWKNFYAEILPLIVPDKAEIYMMRQLAKDPSSRNRIERLGDKLINTNDPTLLQDIFLKVIMDEIKGIKKGEDDIQITNMLSKALGNQYKF